MNDTDLKETMNGTVATAGDGAVTLDSLFGVPREDSIENASTSPDVNSAFEGNLSLVGSEGISTEPAMPVESSGAMNLSDVEVSEPPMGVENGAAPFVEPMSDIESQPTVYVNADGVQNYPTDSAFSISEEKENTVSPMPEANEMSPSFSIEDSVSTIPATEGGFSTPQNLIDSDIQSGVLEEIPQVIIENPNQDMDDTDTDLSADTVSQGMDTDFVSAPGFGEESVHSISMPSENPNDFIGENVQQDMAMEDSMAFMQPAMQEDMVVPDAMNNGSFPDSSMNADMMLDSAFTSAVPSMQNPTSINMGVDMTESGATPSVNVNPMTDITPSFDGTLNIPENSNLGLPSTPASINPNQTAGYVPKDIQPVDLELDKRNQSGMRFLLIFGLIVLIFIILLPFIAEWI